MAGGRTPSSKVRLGEVVGCLSLVTDLATGLPLEHGLRRAVLAVWLGEDLGLDDDELSTAYYVAQLGTVGCALEMASLAPLVKDEIAVGVELVRLDPTRPREAGAFFFRHAGAGEPLWRRLGKVATVARAGAATFQAVCRDVAMRVGDMIDIGPAVRQALGQCHERWDGKGGPQHLEGEEVDVAARIFHVVHDADIFNHIGGVDAVLAIMQQRSGKLYDPRIAARFRELGPEWLRGLDAAATWDGVLAAEPVPPRWLSQAELDEVVRAIGNFVDVRSRYTLGHSVGVATLAESAARGLGLSEGEAVTLRRAGLLHDLGRTGVPVAIWDKAGPLTEGEWRRVKQHPAFTELVLARSSALGHLGLLAGLHHERLDGSGYRAVPASFLSVGARVLAAADAYQTKTEARPHRDAVPLEAAAEALLREAQQGQFDEDVVSALLAAAGHRAPPQKQELPAGLSEREAQVLCLVAGGLSNRQMADELFISPKTVDHHIQHIYNKVGVSTRVGATLFALEHGLV